MQSGNEIEMNEIKSDGDSFHLIKAKYNCPIPLKSLTCLHLYKDTLYLGSRTSKLYIFRL